MHPELFQIGNQTIYSYGVLIMIGAFVGYFYLSRTFKRDFKIPDHKTQNLALIMFFAAFIGGKLLFYLEDPSFYFGSVNNLKKDFGNGFVFYGSLLFAVPSMIWYVKKIGVPVWAALDHIAIVACIVHGFGRMGCFLSGCCYGVPTNSAFAVTFTNPLSKAPLNEPLHPTQLYESTFIFLILYFLFKFKKYQKFNGQLFLLYVMIYALGRGVLEMYRGDEARGYIIEGILTHSQLISAVLILLLGGVYFWLSKRNSTAKV